MTGKDDTSTPSGRSKARSVQTAFTGAVRRIGKGIADTIRFGGLAAMAAPRGGEGADETAVVAAMGELDKRDTEGPPRD